MRLKAFKCIFVQDAEREGTKGFRGNLPILTHNI